MTGRRILALMLGGVEVAGWEFDAGAPVGGEQRAVAAADKVVGSSRVVRVCQVMMSAAPSLRRAGGAAVGPIELLDVEGEDLLGARGGLIQQGE